MKIIALPKVLQYLEDLKDILFEKEYFGFEDTAQKYVDDLFLDIKTTLPIKLKRPAPPFFDRYGKGMYYAVFPKNKRTSWYVFFRIYLENGQEIYQIRYIGNNHMISQHL